MNLRTVIEKLAKLIDPAEAVIDITNIATLNDGDDFLASKSPIVMSVVNLEEDRTLKNQTVYVRDPNDSTKMSRFAHPAQHLILSILFTSYSKDLSKYLDGIDKLRMIIDYFQQNNSFYYRDNDNELITYPSYKNLLEPERIHYTRITCESVSLSMEQLNQMWSYLGSKYMPSALYKMRICTIQAGEKAPQGVITKGTIRLWEYDSNGPVSELETTEF